MNLHELLPWQAALAAGVPPLLLALLAWVRGRQARRQLHEEKSRRAALDDELIQAQASLRHCREHLRSSEQALQPLQRQLQDLDAVLPQAEADAQGRLLRANARFGPIDPLPPGWAEVWAQAEPLLHAGTRWQGLLNLGGDPPRWLGIAIARIETEDESAPVRYLVAGTELAALARQQRDLLDTVERQAEVLDGQGAGGWSWEPGSDRLRLDRRALALLGLPAAGNLIGAGSLLLDRLHPQDQADWRLALARHLRGQEPALQLALRLRHADGHWLPLQVRAAVVQRDPAGEPLRIAGSLLPQAPLLPDAGTAERLSAAAQAQVGLGSLRWLPREGVFEWNEAALALLDQAGPAAALSLEQALQTVAEPDRERFEQALAQAAQGQPWMGDLRLRRALAGERWVRLALAGDAERVQGVLQDQQAQHAQQAEQRFLQLAVDRLPGGIAYWSRDLRCLFANRHYAEQLELSPAQLVGASLDELPFREALHGQLGRLTPIWAGESLRFELALQGRTMLVACEPDSPEHESAGEIQGLMVVALDVSEIKSEQRRIETLNAHLAAERERVQALVSARSQLLLSLGQQMRAPLASLRTRGLAAEAVQAAVQELQGRLDELGDLAQLEAGALALQPAPFRLDALLHDLAKELAQRANDSDLELVYDIDPGLPAVVEGDALRLRQVLSALGREAIARSTAGELRLQLRRLEGGGQQLRIGFALMFGGAAPQALNEGLALSQGLVERMGGSLSLHSQPGEGDRFGFDLVLPEPAQQPAQAMPLGQRLLLVEPNTSSREAITQLAEAEGCELRVAANAARAIETLREALAEGWRPDSLWLAASLPDADALQLAAELRALLSAQDDGATPPRVVLAGKPAQRDALAQRGVGPDAFACKPLARNALRDALTQPVAPVLSAQRPASVPPSLQQRCKAQGLDLQRALQRFLGRPELLRRMALSFAPGAQVLPVQLRAAARDPELAPRAVQALHSFKGLASTLACERLALWARAGEQRLAAAQRLEAVWLDEFEQQLNEGLALLLEATELLLPSTAVSAAMPLTASPPQALQRLDALRALVAAGDAQSLALLTAERAQLLPWLGEVQLQQLEAALAAQDFAQARALLS